jgi:hypothetical protein
VTHDPYAPPKADSINTTTRPNPGPGRISDAEYAMIQARLKSMNRQSLSLGLTGAALQLGGSTMGGVAGGLLSLLGAGLFVAGLSIYARMRGHSPWFGALGLLSCLGMLILLVLPKKCANCQAVTKGATCGVCGAPAPP